MSKPEATDALDKLIKLALAGKHPAALAVLTANGLSAGAFVVRSAEAVAEFFGAKPESVRYWCRTGMPRREVADGKYEYDLREIARWYFAKGKGPATEDEAAARQRKLNADADLTELRADKEREKVLPVAEHQRKLWDLARLFRDRVRLLPEELARRMPGAAGVLQAADLAIEGLCGELASYEQPPNPATEPAAADAAADAAASGDPPA